MKEFLSQRGVKYTERDVSHDRAAAEEMVRKSGQMGVPVIIADGEVIIGFDRNRLEHVLASARTSRPGLGIQVADASKVAGRFGMAPMPGALVGRVAPASLGEKLGLATGDIITAVNSQPVSSADDLSKTVASLSSGTVMRVDFVRNGVKRRTEITV